MNTKEEILDEWIRGLLTISAGYGFITSAMQEYSDQQNKELKERCEELAKVIEIQKNRLLEYAVTICPEKDSEIERLENENRELIISAKHR